MSVLLGSASRRRTAAPISNPIAITFDDGPDTETERLLDLLEAANAKATFFLQGNKVAGRASTVQRMHTLGMGIGNHAWDHPNLSTLTEAQIRTQLSDTSAAITNVTGAPVSIMRPNFGISTGTVASVCADLGLAIIQWSHDPQDWSSLNAGMVRNSVLSTATVGQIVLLHDIHPTTVDAMVEIIPGLQGAGFTMVTVPQIIPGAVAGQTYYSA